MPGELLWRRLIRVLLAGQPLEEGREDLGPEPPPVLLGLPHFDHPVAAIGRGDDVDQAAVCQGAAYCRLDLGEQLVIDLAATVAAGCGLGKGKSSGSRSTTLSSSAAPCMSSVRSSESAASSSSPCQRPQDPRHPAPGDSRHRTRRTHHGVPATGDQPAVGDTQWRADNRSAAALHPRAQRPGPSPLQWLCLEDRAGRSRDRAVPSQRHACPAALLRIGAAGCRREHQALSEHLGHSDPGFTLRTYTHLLPTSEQRTRQAVDRALTGGAATADGLPTAQGPTNQHFRWSAP
jgi:hypothetical protein